MVLKLSKWVILTNNKKENLIVVCNLKKANRKRVGAENRVGRVTPIKLICSFRPNQFSALTSKGLPDAPQHLREACQCSCARCLQQGGQEVKDTEGHGGAGCPEVILFWESKGCSWWVKILHHSGERGIEGNLDYNFLFWSKGTKRYQIQIGYWKNVYGPKHPNKEQAKFPHNPTKIKHQNKKN